MSNHIIAATDVDAYAPSLPTGLNATVYEDGTVHLTWISSSDNASVEGYNIYRDDVCVGWATGNVYNDNAEPGYYNYYIEAVDNEGNNSLYSDSVNADNMPPL